MTKENLKTFLQGAAVGAVVLAVGALWGGLAMTKGSAMTLARAEAAAAVVDHLAPICAAQFARTADTKQMRKDLAAEQSWNRGDFVKAKGWATMPGSDTPNDDIARACADLILKPGV